MKGVLQWKNTPHKTTGLSPAMMPYDHPVQDLVPCHKRVLKRSWHDEKLRVDREAALRKQKLEAYYNKNVKSLKPLAVGDLVCVQNTNTKRWDRYGKVLECYYKIRRYLIKLTSGMVIRRNRVHLRKRFVAPHDTSFETPCTSRKFATVPNDCNPSQANDISVDDATVTPGDATLPCNLLDQLGIWGHVKVRCYLCIDLPVKRPMGLLNPPVDKSNFLGSWQ